MARRAAGLEPPRLRVAVRAAEPAAEARLASLLNGAADVSLVGPDAADVLVVMVAAPSPTPRSALEAASGALRPVLLVDHVDADWALEAVRAGAKAVLPRDVDAVALVQAVRAVAAGLVVLHPQAFHADDRSFGPAFLAEADPNALAEPLEPLTERELQVLHLLADGLSNKAIARRLAISDHTVKFHLASVFSKLDAKSRAEALAQGIRFGLVHL